MILGVVADDLTGAGDIAGMTAKAGYLSVVQPFVPPRAPTFGPEEVCVLDTDSRFDAPEIAYEKVFAATRALQAAGCTRFYNKTCSVFRGNIGPEFDAMMDALGETFAVIVLGFPKNGRLTRGGIHYVHGRRLQDSEFRHDPVHPMTSSSLVDILRGQTARTVAHLGAEVVAGGERALRDALQSRDRANYLILDVTGQADLTVIARAVRDCRVLCGSSALAEELASTWHAPKPAPPVLLPPNRGVGVLCLAGSLTPQTRAQLEHLKIKEVASLTLDPSCLFGNNWAAEGVRIAEVASLHLGRGDEVLVHTPNDPEAVRAAQREGARHGLSGAQVGRLLSEMLAAVAVGCRERTGLDRLVVAGGDTSATVCRALGVQRLRVWREIRPGLPSLLAEASPMFLVLKSGSFGAPDFLAEAVSHLKEAAHVPA